MTQKEQREAIAEFCGWKRCYSPECAQSLWGDDVKVTTEKYGVMFAPGREDCYPILPPDYCNDLNAIYKAEKNLNDWQQELFGGFLYTGHICKFQDVCTGKMVFEFAHKSASERAEAVLRAIGEWAECKE